VSQRVTARHPVTRQLHDGDVLTVAPSCYRIQFDRRELAVELVKDVDVMPLDPTQARAPDPNPDWSTPGAGMRL